MNSFLKTIFLIGFISSAGFVNAQDLNTLLEEVFSKQIPDEIALHKIDSIVLTLNDSDEVKSMLVMQQLELNKDLGNLTKVNSILYPLIGKYKETGLLFGQPLKPSDVANAYNNIGINKKLMGDYSGAIDAYKEGLSLDSSSDVIINNLVSTYMLIGEHQAAIDLAYSIKDSNDRLSLDFVLSMSYYRLGNFDSANYYMNQYEKSNSFDTDIDALILKGDLEILNNNTEQACKSYYKALDTYTSKITPQIKDLESKEDFSFLIDKRRKQKENLALKIHQNCP
jgi:tetratricopeptide (TPR) repeat protein